MSGFPGSPHRKMNVIHSGKNGDEEDERGAATGDGGPHTDSPGGPRVFAVVPEGLRVSTVVPGGLSVSASRVFAVVKEAPITESKL